MSSSLRCDMRAPLPLASTGMVPTVLTPAARRRPAGAGRRQSEAPHADDRPRQWQPLPDPERAGPSTLVRTGAGDLLFDCGRGVLMRARPRRGRRAGSAARPLPDPPAQRPHHRPQRHRHVALDHVASNHIRSPSTAPSGTASLVQATEAMLELDIGYRLAHHADLQWRPSARRRRVRARHGARGRARSGSRPRPPTTAPSAPPWASGSTKGGALGGHRGRHGPVPGTRRAVRRGRHARAHRGAPRPDRADRAAPADSTSSTTTRRSRTRRRRRRATASAPWCSPIWCPRPQPGTEPEWRRWPARTSTAPWSWPGTSSPSTSVRPR